MDEETVVSAARVPRPKLGYGPLVEKLTRELGGLFELRRNVIRIHPERKTLDLQDGAQRSYDVLIWCAPLGGGGMMERAARGSGSNETPPPTSKS